MERGQATNEWRLLFRNKILLLAELGVVVHKELLSFTSDITRAHSTFFLSVCIIKTVKTCGFLIAIVKKCPTKIKATHFLPRDVTFSSVKTSIKNT